MVVINCSECKKLVKAQKGFKLKPKSICPNCVILNRVFVCLNPNCAKVGTLKEGYLDECWTCGNPVCFRCVKKEVTVKGIDFSFCEKHSNPNMKELKEDALRLIEDEM